MPRYYCDYCDIFLTHDTMNVRKAHNSGWKHKQTVRDYYEQFAQETRAGPLHSKLAEFQARLNARGPPPPGGPGTGMMGGPPPLGIPHMGHMHHPGPGGPHGFFPPPGAVHGGGVGGPVVPGVPVIPSGPAGAAGSGPQGVDTQDTAAAAAAVAPPGTY